MSNNDQLAACLSKIDNADKVSKKEVSVNGISNMIKKVLAILQKSNYLGKVEYEENIRGGRINIELVSNINHCGVIKPRFKVKFNEIEDFEKRFLPAKGFGLLVVSTSQGLLTNEEAKKKHIGGRLIAFCY